MRTVAEAERYWDQLNQFHSLTTLKISVSSHNEPPITAGLRSVCWKIFLIFKTLDRSKWLKSIDEARATYDSLRSHYLRAIQHPDEFESSTDPLSEHDESPWTALRNDETLRAEIFQDIERCMPDNVYFRQPATQNMMLDALFVWCKMHPDIGYRQGMHEILAPILWVVERDAIATTTSDQHGADDTLLSIMDSQYIEHDTFTLFSFIMGTAKSFYAPAEPGSTSQDTPMLARSSRIFDRYLPKADPGLSAHLVKLEIVPQIFLLRWIRLLFGREFPLDSALNMWDALFAIDPTLELVDMISIAMLLRIRWQLIEADTNEAFTYLLRYPEPDAPAYTFIKDALYLRDHLTPEGGAEIISRYSKRVPVIEPQISETRPASPSPSFVSSRTRHTATSPRKFLSQQSSGLESILQNAAKGVMDRGSQWGVGKAIRDAVGEVKKNVEAYQSPATSGQTTPRAGGREYRKPSQILAVTAGRPALERTQSSLVKRAENLDKRNRGLAKMLESTIAELWEYHREKIENGKESKDALEALSIAIAKVQFVQVYLEDPSIPLPVDETSEPEPTGITSRVSTPDPESKNTNAPSSSAVDVAATASSATSEGRRHSASSSTTKDSTSLRSPTSRLASPAPAQRPASTLPTRTRPMLSSSNFSWMLGQESEPPHSTFAKASEHSAFPSDEKRRMRGTMGKGYLFGDDEGSLSSVPEGRTKRGSVGSKGGKKGRDEHEVEEEVIDLGDMARKGAVS